MRAVSSDTMHNRSARDAPFTVYITVDTSSNCF